MQSSRSFLRGLTVVFPVTLAMAWVPAVCAATPTPISLTPTLATAGGAAFTLTINGTDFTTSSTSSWGSTPLTTTYVSATQLTADVSASLIAGAGEASVTVCTAGETSSSAVFTIDPPLTAIASLSPASALEGRAFASSTNNANITSTSTWSATPQTAADQSVPQMALPVSPSLVVASGGASTQIALSANPSSPAATVPAATNQSAPQMALPVSPSLVVASGGASTQLALPANPSSPAATAPAATNQSAAQLTDAVHASLVNTLNGTSPGAVLNVNPPTPAIASLNPASAAAGGAAFTLTINGTNFTSTATSSWGSTALATTYISATQLTAAVPASLIAIAGTASITVNTVSGSSSGATFTINPLPTITSMSPTSVLASSTGFTVTVNGTNFLPGAGGTVVRWNYNILVATTYVSSTQVTAVIPASQVSSPGTLSVSVVTAGGITSYLTFTVNPALPVITSLSPSYVNAGEGAFSLTIAGAYFTSTASVNWGSTPLVLTHNGSTLIASIPASLVATAGSVSVTLTTVGGTSAPFTFSIAPPLPAITSLSPASTPAGGAAFTLTINGTGFASNSAIYYSNLQLTRTYVSATQLTAAVPANLIATAGVANLVIYTPGAGFSQPTLFTVNPAPPAITSLSPNSVTAGGAAFMLTINGSAFIPDATVMWGTTPMYTVYISPSQLRIAVPASLIEFSGSGSVTVTTALGTSAPATFTINPSPPDISGLSPGVATAGGAAFTLSISGAYFTSASIVKWGSATLTTTYINQAQLTSTVPANLIASAGVTSVSVTTTAGISASVPVTINPALRITTASMPAGTAGNDYAGAINVTGGSPGYTWTVTGLPGSLSFPNTSDSTLTITGTPVSSGAITFQVSVQDTTGTSAGPASYTINVAAGPSAVNDGSLSGSYVCLFQGSIDTDGTRWATLASFHADGQGSFTSGIFDTNSYDIGSSSGVMTGSYNIGSDNNGMASIHTNLTEGAAGIQTTQWAIALSGDAQPAQQFRMIEADDLGTLPSYQQGTANCYLATASAFVSSTISGNSFAFGLDGEDNSGNMKAAVGLFSASGGMITGGNIDRSQGGSATVQSDAFTATYTTPDPASGRFTMDLTGAGNFTGFTVYIIDASRMFILDNTNDDGEQAGNMRTRQQASYSAASIDGPFVLYMRGAEFNSSGNTPSGFYSNVFQGTGDGAGNMTIHQSYTDDAGVYSAGSSNSGPAALTYDPVHPGRATFTSASGTTYLSLFNNTSAFEMGVKDNGSVDSGWLEAQTAAQTQTAFTNEALAGNYLFGNLPLLNIEPTSSLGVFGVTGSGTVNANLTITSRGILSWDQSTSMTYSWDATAPGTGTFLVANGTQAGASCAVISATKFVCASQTDSAPSVEVFEQ
jgi:hypothetical protein